MVVFKDKLSGDELLSDFFPIKDVGGFWLEVQPKVVPRGDHDPSTGASAEETEDDPAVKKLDIVATFGLVEAPSLSKKEFISYWKGWSKKVVAALPEEIQPDIKRTFHHATLQLLADWNEYELYTGKSKDPQATCVYMRYIDDPELGPVPVFQFPKWALQEHPD